ncbi:MAG: type II toxin-antitoxin system HicB family antitoxin [Chloroflexi bacterium]|nr:type II toxin-antitoxin system HicB family antitoxin [Chloroflexota bacterium]
MRQVLLYQDEDGVWIAEVPSLPGCGSDGETREEALANVREAIDLWIEDALERGETIPEDYSPIMVVQA